MVYTIKNSCVEMPELPYDDGARTIFLYTKGTEGDPPEELRQLMRYMEHSTLSNAQTAGLARLHQMVTDVKADREVGLTYMKSCEIERYIRAEGKAEEKAENIIQLLSRFRDVPEDEQEQIRSEKNLKVLDSWYKDALQYMEDTLLQMNGELQHRKDALQQAEVKAKAEMVLKLLDDYEIPETLKKRILSETNPELLELWFQVARHAKSLDEFTEKAAL